jgi:hypothetical protein
MALKMVKEGRGIDMMDSNRDIDSDSSYGYRLKILL